MRSSAGIDHRPEPFGRGGDFFYCGERMPAIRGASSSGRKDVQAGFYRSWLYGWKTGLLVGAGPSIESGLCCLLQEHWRNGLNRSLLLLGGFRCRRFECGEDDGGSALDDLQTLCEECGVAMIQTDVVRRIFPAESLEIIQIGRAHV